jgi:hypothetical protein
VVDVDDIAEDDWRAAALWSAGVALALLGVALILVAWRIAPPVRGWLTAKVAVTVAIVAVVAGAITVGLAQEQGGSGAAAPPPAPVREAAQERARDDSTPPPDAPVRLGDAIDIDQLVAASLPVDVRTTVQLELTQAGRVLAAEAGGCAPRDYRGAVLGVAIGGSWAQPLVLVGKPLNADGEPIERCRNAIIRLPLAAGLALPQ